MCFFKALFILYAGNLVGLHLCSLLILMMLQRLNIIWMDVCLLVGRSLLFLLRNQERGPRTCAEGLGLGNQYNNIHGFPLNDCVIWWLSDVLLFEFVQGTLRSWRPAVLSWYVLYIRYSCLCVIYPFRSRVGWGLLLMKNSLWMCWFWLCLIYYGFVLNGTCQTDQNLPRVYF